MLRSRGFLGLTLVAALLAGCSDDPASPLAPTPGSEPLLARGANSQGLIRMEFPGDFPGLPAYARIEPVPPHVFMVDGWAVIIFYRNPECVRPGFNLLTFFDAPAAFGCALTVEGFSLFEAGAFPGAPKISHAQGTGAVPVWFVPAEVILAAMADGVLTIDELEGLDGLLVGSATHFNETHHPIGGGHPNPKLIQTARGTLENGRRFQYQLTEIGGEVKSIRLRFK